MGLWWIFQYEYTKWANFRLLTAIEKSFISWLEHRARPCQTKACLWSLQGKTGPRFLQREALPQRVTLPILVDNSSPSPPLPVGTKAPLPLQSRLQFPALLSASLLDIPVIDKNHNLCKQQQQHLCNHVGKIGPINLEEQLDIWQTLSPWKPWKQSNWATLHYGQGLVRALDTPLKAIQWKIEIEFCVVMGV